MTPNLILASGSSRRKKLLAILGIPFQVEVADIDETRLEKESPRGLVERLSNKKAMAIARGKRDVIVIGADTIVLLGDDILEKPTSEENAREMLTSLSGETHTVYTGVSIIRADRDQDRNHQVRFVEKTLVTFGEISDDHIDHYIQSGSPFDKAGGYGIQDDRGALFVERLNGDFYNVMGLPIFRLNQFLQSEFAILFAED